MHSHKVVHQWMFAILVAFVTLAFFGLVGTFLLTCLWAAVLAIIFRRAYRRIRVSLRGRSNLAAFLTTMLILFAVVIPVLLIMVALIDQSVQVYQKIESGEWNVNEIGELIDQNMPTVESYLEKVGLSSENIQERINNFLLNAAQTIANRALSITSNAIGFVIEFILMLYLLFFFLRDGREIVNNIINVVPLGNRREKMLLQRFSIVAQATLKGTFIVAIIQGAIGGVLFASLGIPGALFWGVIMFLLSMLPIGGSGLVWGPAAIILFVQGAIVKAVIMVIVGALIIGLVDNLLRPLLVGRDTKMPDYLVLLSILGGIAWIGFTGFILGPVIAALFLTCWEMAGREWGGREN